MARDLGCEICARDMRGSVVVCSSVLYVRMSFDPRMLFTSMPKGKVTSLPLVVLIKINKTGKICPLQSIHYVPNSDLLSVISFTIVHFCPLHSSSSNNPHPIIIAPIIIKTVLPIPKISVPSLSTSTFVQTSTTRENVPDTDIHSTIATQTILDSFLSPAVHQACQTQTVPSNDFGTQTLLLASRAVSPPPTLLSSDQSPITIREDELCFSELLPPECMEFGTQTLDTSLEDIACLDFGVQTLLTSGTKDQSSQTLL